MKAELTAKQQKVLDVIRDHIVRHGYPPSEREIARKLKIQWVRAVQNHLGALEKKGYIERGGRIRRGIRLMDTAFGVETPVVGRIAAA